jgi:hypothetical protein
MMKSYEVITTQIPKTITKDINKFLHVHNCTKNKQKWLHLYFWKLLNWNLYEGIMNWKNNKFHNLRILGLTLGILGNLCHFHVVLIIIYKVYYRHESDDFSQVQPIVIHVSLFFPWFCLCTILTPIYTKFTLFRFVLTYFILNLILWIHFISILKLPHIISLRKLGITPYVCISLQN